MLDGVYMDSGLPEDTDEIYRGPSSELLSSTKCGGKIRPTGIHQGRIPVRIQDIKDDEAPPTDTGQIIQMESMWRYCICNMTETKQQHGINKKTEDSRDTESQIQRFINEEFSVRGTSEDRIGREGWRTCGVSFY
ncbi:hypothetical protein CHARACLAT_024336 [Characodon lateralis]|uniref:Uncharacterized protein n=1 Tax=Characodon lateralis TaxID=208331 RepID=A0ABU7E551_9TELE|nr:hypothetical protein [Characodon lateralis]